MTLVYFVFNSYVVMVCHRVHLTQHACSVYLTLYTCATRDVTHALFGGLVMQG